MVWRRLVLATVGVISPIAMVLHAGQETTVEERARRLESRLVAPCCFRQVLTMHDSDPARTMKEEIRRELEAGRSDEEILESYVGRYGVQILSEPPATGFHRILSAAPPVLFAISLGALLAILHRWRLRTRNETPAAPLHAETVRRIQREMGSL